MSTGVLAGTGFRVENDIYSRMATDKIVVKGKYYFHSTPPIALTASIRLKPSKEKDSQTTALTAAFAYPILMKANRSVTILPDEGFHVPVYSGPEHDVVEIEPRTRTRQSSYPENRRRSCFYPKYVIGASEN